MVPSESVSWTREAEPLDPVHDTPNLFHTIFFRKIIYLILENSRRLDFCRKPPILYFIYVLVTTILQKQP
jgi:hypothetical protein